MVINAASLRTSGKRICRSLRGKAQGCSDPANPDSQTRIAAAYDPSVGCVLTPAIHSAKAAQPDQPTYCLARAATCSTPDRSGLDLERKRVRCQGREATLTPRLAQLLKIFMEHPGEVLERERLCSGRSGIQNIPATPALWMYTSAGCARRSKKTRASHVSSRPSAASATGWIV